MSKVAYDERVSAQAAAWLARLHAGDLAASGEAAFYQWLAADPANASAFEDATNIWDRLGAIPRKEFLCGGEKPGLTRRALMAGVAGVAVTLVSAPLFQKPAEADIYRTAVGERRRLPLPDGTNLLLDTNTSLSVEITPKICLVHLQNGRLNCSVAQSQRRFVIKADDRSIVGNKSNFDLSYIEDYFSVVLIRGEAFVSSTTGLTDLSQGERAAAIASQPLKRDRPSLSELTAWQTGHLIFSDQALGDAVKEMNRYSKVKLEVAAPQLSAQRISGGYKAGDNADFAESLTHLYPIEVRRVGDTIQLSPRSDI